MSRSKRTVFPACAGMFRSPGRRGHCSRCFPRVRGDVPVGSITCISPLEFSPRARGCSGHTCILRGPANVFPACAGMFRTSQVSGESPMRFPRVRGDVPAKGCTSGGTAMFSPRARGCSCGPVFFRLMLPVFPACAGMFLCGACCADIHNRFPRKHEDLPPLRTWNFSTGEYSPRKREHSGNPP